MQPQRASVPAAAEYFENLEILLLNIFYRLVVFADSVEENGREYQSEERHANHSEEHGSPESLAQFRARVRPVCERHDAQNERERRHQNA